MVIARPDGRGPADTSGLHLDIQSTNQMDGVQPIVDKQRRRAHRLRATNGGEVGPGGAPAVTGTDPLFQTLPSSRRAGQTFPPAQRPSMSETPGHPHPAYSEFPRQADAWAAVEWLQTLTLANLRVGGIRDTMPA